MIECQPDTHYAVDQKQLRLIRVQCFLFTARGAILLVKSSLSSMSSTSSSMVDTTVILGEVHKQPKTIREPTLHP